MQFDIIPAVDMKNGKCVQLVQGVPGSEMISLDNPLEVASEWIDKGASTLHLIDLDGAFGGSRKNAPLIKEIINQSKQMQVSIQVGGGVRSLNDASNILDLGADRVILSTAAINNPQIVNEIAKEYGSDSVMVALDAKNGKVSIEGWTKQSAYTPVDLGMKFQELGAGSLLFTNIDSEGLLKGIDISPTRDLIQSVSIPVIASGGVSCINDIMLLRDIGASGVVVGSALYKHKINYQDALIALNKRIK
ncbi:1-(5-phosphoribosyl)-5-[(5-phosphoribosylamino)methylideneamino] imidazole-4-carboxamide isomerase [Methanosalsum natronophilum]|uniref:1-(5-phosphoribosyl)-5-[(5-phosphoribosylamino)methylideneamino] imidazole-4-carboxamide isomerase n=1 Tax=Methanosalsum natronophilum TaxID=768733 RepID=A0A3R7XD83_9EURY|nr:MAG: 1-(5-phosphoribosyl)-5-[(5-phosphoribosylamino)methylideneamino] imidazole-4-carboxamide isomerase [Methanosalsum natronophilum]